MCKRLRDTAILIPAQIIIKLDILPLVPAHVERGTYLAIASAPVAGVLAAADVVLDVAPRVPRYGDFFGDDVGVPSARDLVGAHGVRA